MFGGAGLYFTSALVSIPSQAFFVYRMWQFSRRPWFIPAFALPALLFQFVFPLVLLSGRLPEQRMALFIANCVASAILDLLTCVGLTVLLWERYVNWEAQKSTTTILLRLMLLSVNTGLWTTLVSIYVIVGLVYTTRAHEQPPLGCYHLISPLYFTTVLVNLNSRQYIRNAANRTVSSTIRVSERHNPTSFDIPLDMMKSKGHSSTSDLVPRDQSGMDKSKDLHLTSQDTVV
ncbi:hypothetical protein CPB84DRAFT_1779059 [Gymnopilus junonius]|uniref:DUF6534 domain-containing protein n=1 Tax=Gymnopilus junonius TaxID=109634 RepID=A0A9P5TN05_GYMJU|nr:hypothetical protein CPB84DRAFT_1779059 [Gymnopilus junonius]